MANHNLTETTVKRLRPRASRYDKSDGGGLELRVFPSGVKTWRHRFRLDGKIHIVTLGNWPDVSLSAARAIVAGHKDRIRSGTNPAAKVEQGKRSVATFFHDYFAKAPMKGRKQLDEKRRLIEKDVIPVIGNMDVAAVSRRELLLILEGIAGRGAPVVANRVREILVHAFGWAEVREEIEASPAGKLPKMVDEKPRDVVVPIGELATLWRQLSGEVSREKHQKPVSVAVAGALKLIMLTACRTADARDATPNEFDGRVWTIPGSRFKTGEEHRIFLSAPALEIVEQARAASPDSPYLFSARGGARLGDKSLIQALKRLNGGAYSVHDLRRSVATHTADLGVEPHIIGRMLGHKPQGVTAVYNRGRYDEPARKAWAQWAERFTAAVEGIDNVVSLREAS